MRKVFFCLAAVGVSLVASTISAKPRHLSLGEEIVDNIRRSDNVVGTEPNYLLIPGIDDVDTYQSRNLCATFISNLLKKSYDISNRSFRRWTGSTSPYSNQYYDLIISEKGFERITNIDDVEAGDFIIFAYGPDMPVTGHSMVVASKPEPMEGHSPKIGEYAQYSLEVLDNGSGHGRDDTRHPRFSGVGKGTIRAYVDRDGEVIAFAWSLADYSTIYQPPEKRFAIGRLTRYGDD